MSLRRSLTALVLACTFALAGHEAASTAPHTTPTRTLIAAGDIASCTSNGDEQTAELVSRIPGTIAVLGDIAYENGSAEDFAKCFEPSWGKLVPRIKAALGNHEYNAAGAAPAFEFFKLPGKGWYSYSLGAWHVIVLNSNCSHVGGCERDSRQGRWLQADLAAHPGRCTLAYWHHPRFSSGIHGSDVTYAPFWDILAHAKADLVLSGHDHDYERFAPLKGIRSFVVGTGGKGHYPTLIPRPGSVVRNGNTFGVLKLTLRATDYDWKFLPAGKGTFTDAGTGRCR